MKESSLISPEADKVFSALADPTRRRILVRLAEKPDDAGSIGTDLEISRQAVAKQLRLLEEAGLVSSSRQARRLVHRAETDRIREVSDLLGAVAAGWERRLADVARRAEEHYAQTSTHIGAEAGDGGIASSGHFER